MKSTQVKAALDALNRKERSERILAKEGVPVNTELPLIEPSGEVEPRTLEEVAYRTLCLTMVAIKAERMDQTMVLRVIRQYGLAPHFSQREKAFIRDTSPSGRTLPNFSWKYESAWTLLWSLGYVEHLAKPESVCDVPHVVACMRDRTTGQFIKRARLRPLAQILDQADLNYRYHWAVTDAGLKRSLVPANLNPGVVYERHYALNWLIRSSDQDWDDVTTDT